MTHDFKAALEAIDNNQIGIKTDQFYPLGNDVTETIIAALRIADKLMEAPTDEMYYSGKQAMEESKKQGLVSHAASCFVAMRDQMLRELQLTKTD